VQHSAAYWYQKLRSGNYTDKPKAYNILKKMSDDGNDNHPAFKYYQYQECHLCGRLGKIVQRKIVHYTTWYVYHYSREEGIQYCPRGGFAKKESLKQRTVMCPRCKKIGLYTKRKEVHCGYDNGIKSRLYEIVRVIVYHRGAKRCYINKKELAILRKKYGFKDTTTTWSVPVRIENENGENEIAKFRRKAGSRPKLFQKKKSNSKYVMIYDKYYWSKSDVKIVNKLGMSLTGTQRIRHILRTLEGQLQAKKTGKEIRFDVEKKVAEWKNLLEIKEKEIEERKTREEELLQNGISTGDGLLGDDLFEAHWQKIGIKNELEQESYSNGNKDRN